MTHNQEWTFISLSHHLLLEADFGNFESSVQDMRVASECLVGLYLVDDLQAGVEEPSEPGNPNDEAGSLHGDVSLM